jgi:DNA-binding MarR family transcriptional regulator
VRFSLLASLAHVDSADYQSLREALVVSYALLSKHAALLEEAGYIKVQKTAAGRTRQTRYRLTNRGRRAYEKHVQALERIIGGGAFDVHDSERAQRSGRDEPT